MRASHRSIVNTLSVDPAWQDVLEAFAAAYAAVSTGGSCRIRSHLEDVASRIQRCRAEDPDIVMVPSEYKPVCAYLERALVAAAGPASAAFRRALGRVASRIAWRYGYRDMPEALRTRYAYAEVLGPEGPVACRDLILGLVLFGPGCDYPAHAHQGITESYICLSGAISQNAAGVWPPGSLILNPPGHVHAITSDPGMPALLAYAWTGTPEALAGFEMVFASADATP